MAGSIFVRKTETFVAEPNTTISIRIVRAGSTSGATISTPDASAAILNDDINLALLPVTVAQVEGDSGSRSFTFTATRTGTGPAATVDWAALPYGADTADFVGGIFPSGSLTFGPNDTSKTITVQTVGDTGFEPDDWFKVVLQVPSAGASITNDTAFGTILADDSEITISPRGPVAYEHTAQPASYGFVLTRNSATPAGQTVSWFVRGADGLGTIPANGADFVGGVLPSGTVTWAEGEVRKDLIINVAGDTITELNERFEVVLTAPSAGAHLGHDVAHAIILNDDARFGIGPHAVFKGEGNAANTAMTFVVTRTGYLDTIATVGWSVAAGSVAGTMPVSASDFVGGVMPAGTLTFANGVATQVITVDIAADRRAELNESFTVTLASASGAGIAVGTAHGIVTDDDTIHGTIGNDSLAGTPGPDLFIIGQGQDSIAGGDGGDQFRFLTSALGPVATHRFTFTDFSPAAGEILDLGRIDAIAGTPVNDAFTFIGTAAFSGTPGELRWQASGGQLLVQGNTNADPAADLTLLLSNAGPVSAGWFVL